MANIHIMSATLASQVAAGEVVERPASVIKELIENSLDAGAKSIHVEIRQGGSALIKVTDDGAGMSEEDALLCIQRHATSKLKNVEELFAITNLGFRGEALPSIASVSRLKLSTRTHEALEGCELLVHGGIAHEPRASGLPPGTSIEVSELFFNTPVRRKFLKSNETESAHIEHQIRLHALAFPHVRFNYKRDGQTIFDWYASHDDQARIASIMGTGTAESLLPIPETIGPGVCVKGFLQPLTEARRSKKSQYIFLNNRPIDDQFVNRAVRDGYGGLAAGLYPALFLHIEVEPSLVDVNVHPSKKEVRFRRQNDVAATIIEAINLALQAPISAKSAPSQPLQFEPKDQDLVSIKQTPTREETTSTVQIEKPELPTKQTPTPIQFAKPTLRPLPARQSKLDLADRNESTKDVINQSPTSTLPNGFVYLGQLHQTWPMYESPEGLVIMNPKAARERIIFEELRQVDKTNTPSQQLLSPIIIDLDPRDVATIKAMSKHIEASGIHLTPFGNNTIRIEAIPAMIEPSDTKQFFIELIDKLSKSTQMRANTSVAYEQFISELAKKSAQQEQINPSLYPQILGRLMQCEVPYCTPQGKPTLIHYSLADIKRKFGQS